MFKKLSVKFNIVLSTKKFVNYWTLIVFFLIFMIYIFNFLIDPYGEREIVCQNIYKPVLNERAKKYNYLFRENNIEKYDSLILGSSRVMQLIPSHFKDTNPYNFGIHVGNNVEKLYILKEWLKRKKLKKVYLGIDYYNFHKNNFPLRLNYQKFSQNYDKAYLSLASTNLSIKSLKNHLQKKPQTFFEKDGNINYYSDDMLIGKGKYNFSNEKYKQMAFSNIENDYIKNHFEVEEGVFSILEEFKELSEKNHFELIVFITPSHSESLKLQKQNKELNNKFIKIKEKMTQIFDKIYDFSEDDSYNSINENFYDTHHYRSTLGDKMIVEFENNSGLYGQIITKTKQQKGNN